MSISWKTYEQRRGVTLREFITSRNIETYEEFLSFIRPHSIYPPHRDAVDAILSEVAPDTRESPDKHGWWHNQEPDAINLNLQDDVALSKISSDKASKPKQATKLKKKMLYDEEKAKK
jgi:hypothetical protein